MNRALNRLLKWLPGFFLLAVFSFSVQASEHEVVWDKVERGILYTRLEVESLVNGQRAWIHVYNIDTSRYSLRLFHSRELSDNRSLSFDEWYRETGSPVLFNACAEEASNDLQGYFRVAGETLQGRIYKAWKGVLAMGPADGSFPLTRIIDLNVTSFDTNAPSYRDVIQQPMLLDEEGNLRVSPRDFTATRIAMAEDENRNVLVFLTEDPCTLWEMARWLRNSPFGLTQAMSMGSGNAPQVLGQYAPERIYIMGERIDEGSGGRNGSMLTELSSALKLNCVLGIEHISR